MPITEPLVAPDIAAAMILGTEGPKGRGILFLLRLPYRDETVSPPRPTTFDHRWVVSRATLDQAEREGRINDWLLHRQAMEEHSFLKHLERIMRKNSTRLLRVDHDIVLRKIGAGTQEHEGA